MSEHEKKRQCIYDLLNAETKPKFLCLPYTTQRKNCFFLPKTSFLNKRGVGRKIEQKLKRRLFNFSCDKEEPHNVNELKFQEKNVRTAIKQDLSPLITLYGAFSKTKQMQLPIQILVL